MDYKQIDNVIKTGKIIDSSDKYITFSKTETLPSNTVSATLYVNNSGKTSNVVNKVQTNVELVSLDGNIPKLMDSLNANGGSTERSKDDDSYSATLTTRVYYSEYEVNNKTYYAIDKVTGNLDGGVGSGVRRVSSSATIGQEDITPHNGYHSCVHNLNLSVRIGRSSWSYNTPSSWANYPVADDASNYAGCNYYVTLARGSSSLRTVLSNDIFGRNNDIY